MFFSGAGLRLRSIFLAFNIRLRIVYYAVLNKGFFDTVQRSNQNEKQAEKTNFKKCINDTYDNRNRSRSVFYR